MKKYLGVFFATTLLLAEPAPYETIPDENQLTIKTPAFRKRETAKIRLENGLEAVIVSDPSIDQSGAALSVEVGSWSDPDEYPGMAHFLEHMLFLGNKAYPEEDEFFKYIFDHGGGINAYTAPDRTVYIFSVNNADFLPAMDRFSNFFISPLFLTSGINRELNAVDQENDKNIENDGWRYWMIMKATGNQKHPNAKFSTGNADTLGNIPRSAVKAWFETHYDASAMHLFVYSSLPMDELKKAVTHDFSPITNSGLTNPPNVAKLLSKDQEGHKLYINPIKDLRSLEMTWELPTSLGYDLEGKSAELLSEILSKKTDGSLLSLLKKEEIAESLSVRSEQISKENYLFVISINLTKYGVLKVDQAIERTFEMLGALRRDGIAPYHFDEMKKSQQLGYEFQSRSDAFSYVSQSAHALVDEPISTFPQKTYTPSEFEPKKMEKLLAILSPQNCVFAILASPELTGVTPTHKEPWLGGEYAIKKVSQEQLAKWSELESHGALYQPKPNPFMPDHLALIPALEDKRPQLISDDQYGRVYFAPDPEYQTPTATTILSFSSPLIDESARSQVLLSLYITSLKESLSSTLSYASDANLSAYFRESDMRFQIILDGFSEKSPRLLKEILKECKNVHPTRDQFEIYRDRLQSAIANQNKNLLYIQAKDKMDSLLFNDVPQNSRLKKAIEQISYEDFTAFADKLFLEAYLEGMISGNMTLGDAKMMARKVRTNLTYAPFPVPEQPQREVLILPQDQGPYMVFETTPMQGNNVILTIQQGPFSFQKGASQHVLGAALKQAFFLELRTKQQTGYVAKSWHSNVESQMMQFFTVQSTTHNPLDLLSRFELFLENYSKNVGEHISKERFEEIRSSAIEQLEKAPPNLTNYTLLMNRLAFKENGDFDYVQKRIAALKELTYEEMKADAVAFFSRQNSRRLALLIDGVSPDGKGFKYQDISPTRLHQVGTFVSSND